VLQCLYYACLCRRCYFFSARCIR